MDYDLYVDVSDEDAKLLEKYASEEYEFRECEELNGVYRRVLDKVLESAADDVDIEDVAEDLDIAEDDVTDDNVMNYLEEYYSWNIGFPYELLHK